MLLAVSMRPRPAWRQAARRGRRKRRWQVPVAAAAQGLQALVVGLIHTWLLAPQAFELVPVGEVAIGAYLAGLGLTPGPAGPTAAPDSQLLASRAN